MGRLHAGALAWIASSACHSPHRQEGSVDLPLAEGVEAHLRSTGLEARNGGTSVVLRTTSYGRIGHLDRLATASPERAPCAVDTHPPGPPEGGVPRCTARARLDRGPITE